jgi:hypothetical protein
LICTNIKNLSKMSIAKNILLYSGSILMLAFNSFGQQYWSTIKFTDNLKDKLLTSDKYIHSDFVNKDANGKWQSSLLDQNGNQVIDTTFYLIGANCEIDNGEPHIIRFCKCNLENDSLFIKVYDSNPSYSDNINVLCSENNFTSNYNTVYTAFYPGQEYIWKTKKQKLKLSTSNFKKGKWLNGHISMNIDEFFKSDTYPLTFSHIKIKGFFKCVIE